MQTKIIFVPLHLNKIVQKNKANHMAFIITVANAKGGVGKSTIAYCLACYYAKRGADCAILDEDIQQTISDNIEMFHDRGEDVSVSLIDRNELPSYAALRDLPHDIVFVDTPPVLTTQLEDIYDVSDMVLIPIKPSTHDYKSLMRSIDTIQDVMRRNKNLTVAIALNMVVKSSNVQDSFRKAFEGQPRVKVLQTELANRVIHTKYMLEKASLFQTDDKMAQQEMAALGDEIYYLLTL